MSDKKQKRSKVNCDEKGGPMGVGETLEEINDLNIFEFLQDTSAFKELTNDLNKDQMAEVLKESQKQADGYQKVLDHFKEILSTEEGKRNFASALKKKVGGR